MPRRPLIEPPDLAEKTRGAIAGNERVAHRFLPARPASALIWLNAPGRRHAPSRRRLARLIDSRRVVS
ncbi:MAG TPA: hypothetical protein VE087_07450 [Xanthobacteraceae bacterium]|nr:hypothetical protein [Xanthobacteraceae bacterium]